MTEPVKKLEEILLDDSKPDRMTRIGTLASPAIRQALTTFLKDNRDVFAWSHEDMPRIYPTVMVHRLSISSFFPPIHQNKRVFAPEQDQAIVESPQATRGELHPRSLLPQLVGKHGNGQES